jgi:phage head maturation protease
MTLAAVFKYTFPITKSEQRADGRYIMGYASGPEVDLEGERMAPEAINRFAEQINSGGSELIYRDAHAPDGVLRDLGVITKAWVNEHFHLGIEVKLDEDNPASDFLWKSVNKGKQYGMSVSGRVLDYADEYLSEAAKVVRTYKNVVLDEISNTTRPAWYPSFGTVLSKSIKDAAQTAGSTGENTLEKDELLDTTVEDATKSEETVVSDDTTEKAVDETTDEAVDEATEKSEVEATDEGEVDKAGRSISATNGQKLLALYNEMTTTLTDLGLLGSEEADKTDSTDEEATLDKSTEATADDGRAALEAQVAELAKTVTEQAARIEELQNAPKTVLPTPVSDETKKSEDFAAILSKASPADRIRLAMALHTQGR